MSEQSSIEIPVAPAWLSKLESSREKLTKGRIGHESGAGARCIVCGSDCPGLDLHFWRKVCRNCKCRKDQHDIEGDGISGWAQFEILGAIRSKPAFLSVSALANKEVQLDWVPPNVTPDLANDYLSMLRADQIPISGSAAATHRKQQLEYQVPPHDLDPNLCHNLTNNEQEQLKEHVMKIKESCVGQGFVTRIGIRRGSLASIGIASNELVKGQKHSPVKYSSPGKKTYVNSTSSVGANQISEIFGPVGKPVLPSIEKDKILSMVLNSAAVNGVRFNPTQIRPYETLQIYDSLGNRIPTMKNDFINSPYLSEVVKDKLVPMKINSESIQSSVVHGWAYDKIFNDLDSKKLNYAHDTILGPIKNFRIEYLKDENLKNETDYYAVALGGDIFSPYANKIAKLTQSTDTSPNHNSSVLPAMITNKHNNALIKSDDVHYVNPNYSGPMLNKNNDFPSINYSTFPSSRWQDLSTNASTNLRAVGTNENQQTNINRDAIKDSSLSYSKHSNNSNHDTLPNLNLNVSSNADKLYKHSSNENPHIFNHDPDYRRSSLQTTPDLISSENINQRSQNPNNRKENFADNSINPHYVQEAVSENIQNPLGYQLNISKNPQLYLANVLDCFKNPHTTSYLNKTINRSAGYILQANPGKFYVNSDLEHEIMAPHVQSGIIQNKFTTEHLSQGVGSMHITPEDFENIPIMSCKECKKEVKSGDVAVQAERAGNNVAWHPQCFVCHTCHELLADLVYFFHKNNVYCARDLADILKIPRCNACDELIFTREYTAAEGAAFHIKHFCCFECDAPLADQSYTQDDKTNQPMCLNCYEIFHAAKCRQCNKSIGASEQGVSLGSLHWHKSCFICSGKQCGKALLGEKFSLKMEMLFCSSKCVQSMNAN